MTISWTEANLVIGRLNAEIVEDYWVKVFANSYGSYYLAYKPGTKTRWGEFVVIDQNQDVPPGFEIVHKFNKAMNKQQTANATNSIIRKLPIIPTN